MRELHQVRDRAADAEEIEKVLDPDPPFATRGNEPKSRGIPPPDGDHGHNAEPDPHEPSKNIHCDMRRRPDVDLPEDLAEVNCPDHNQEQQIGSDTSLL